MIAITNRFLKELGGTTLFAFETFGFLLRRGIRFSQFLDQMVIAGVRSLPITLIVALFVGAIMAIEINIQLKDFGAQGFLGGLATSTTIRNVGPVLIAFMLSAKVGAYTSAELGTMRVTEQIDAIRCLGVNPVQYLIVPRMAAIVVSSFLLLVIGLMVSIGGGILISNFALGVNALNYITNIPTVVTYWSVGIGLIKSFVFGALISVICCYRGYYTTGGAQGVGKTVKSTAVRTLVCIIVADFSFSLASDFLYDLFGIGQL